MKSHICLYVFEMYFQKDEEMDKIKAVQRMRNLSVSFQNKYEYNLINLNT